MLNFSCTLESYGIFQINRNSSQNLQPHTVFALGTRTEARPDKSAHDWLSQIEEIVTKSIAAAQPDESADGWLNHIKKLFTKPIPSYPAYQLKNESYPPIEEDVTFWCVKP